MTKQRIALITGANKGLGLEMARQLGRQGITIIAAARSETKAEAAAEALRADKVDAHPLILDVTDPRHIEAAVARIDKDFGRLDILMNNAGIFLDGEWFGNSSSTVSQETLRSTFDTNVFGLIALTQACLPLLEKSASGRIVNMSSIIGSLGMQADSDSMVYGAKPLAYSASKAALNAFTIHLAQQVSETAIKVNSAHPGWVKTDLGTDAAPMGVQEGAQTGVWLATLPADGPNGGFFHGQDRLPW